METTSAVTEVNQEEKTGQEERLREVIRKLRDGEAVGRCQLGGIEGLRVITVDVAVVENHRDDWATVCRPVWQGELLFADGDSSGGGMSKALANYCQFCLNTRLKFLKLC